MIDDLTRLSYWFPKLEAAGLPVPKTKIIRASDNDLECIYATLDGDTAGLRDADLIREIQTASDSFGYPSFLRTDHTSAKHDWKDTCYLPDGEPKTIRSHVHSIVYFWECVNMIAPPCDVWVVREFLPTIPLGVCPEFGGMPICREFRFFVKDDQVLCHHPYWPKEALEQGGAQYNEEFDLDVFNHIHIEDIAPAFRLASEAGKAVGGSWSVDILETRNGWFVTDMAEAVRSFHWNGCEVSA